MLYSVRSTEYRKTWQRVVAILDFDASQVDPKQPDQALFYLA